MADQQRCFAVMAADDIRLKSSSGGAFTVLAESILAQGGAVCGAEFTEDLHCRYGIVEDAEDLARFRGSKYVKAAFPRDFFSRVGAILEAGRPVLFSGTPCQVAAVRKAFIGFADRLFTVDLICAGAPRERLFRRYLDENWGLGNVRSYEFRNKSKGWRHHHFLIHVTLKDGREDWRDSSDDEHMQAMKVKFNLSAGCFNCRYCNLDRPGDITLADFWKIPAAYDDGKGTSAMLVNTAQGQRLFENVRGRFKMTVELPVSELLSRQGRLRRAPVPRVGYDKFVQLVEQKPVREALRDCLSDIDRNVAIFNFHWETVNFGAVLTAYALNQALRSWGFDARNVDFKPALPRVARKPPNPRFDDFRHRHLPVSHFVRAGASMAGLNAMFGSFVTGSDQVWNPGLVGAFQDAYFLTFTDPDKRLVSASASFGCNPLSAYGAWTLRRLLKPFTALGVREESACSALNGIGVKAVRTADPVFLLDRAQWQALADGGTVTSPDRVVWYAVNAFGKEALNAYFARQADGKDCPFCLDAQLGVEDWLTAISRASLVLTDSFHALCFAILFERPFAVLVDGKPKSDRIRGLLKDIGLEGRIFSDPADIPPLEELKRDVDFTLARDRIVTWRQELSEFLKTNLSRPKPSIDEGLKARRAALRALAAYGIRKLLRHGARLVFAMCGLGARAEIGRWRGEISRGKAQIMRVWRQYWRLRSWNGRTRGAVT